MTTAGDFMASFKVRHAAPKAKRKSAKQQVAEARENLLKEIRAQMINKKRTIPKEWERGFMAAVGVIEIMGMQK